MMLAKTWRVIPDNEEFWYHFPRAFRVSRLGIVVESVPNGKEYYAYNWGKDEQLSIRGSHLVILSNSVDPNLA